MPRSARAPTPLSDLTIRDLISYRLSRTASLMSRGAALRYRREFDVSLGEWRAVALLAAGARQSLMQLARAAALDKAQMSRVVTSLVERGLVERGLVERGLMQRDGAAGRRSGALSLTSAGRTLYAGLIEAAAERDRAFRAALEPEELLVLEVALGKLADRARQFIEE